MVFYWLCLLAALVGAALSLFVIVIRSEADNAAKIPVGLVAQRAAGTLFLFVCCFVFAVVVSSSVFEVLGVPRTLNCILAAGLSFVFSQVNYQDLISERWYQFLPSRVAAVVLIKITETLRLVWTKTVDDIEQDLDKDILRRGVQEFAAIDRLFEMHLGPLMRDIAARLPADRRHDAAACLRLRSHSMKFKPLLRHLGYTRCLRELDRVRHEAPILFPNWPWPNRDRRREPRRCDFASHRENDRRQHYYGRRQFDHPDTLSAVLVDLGRSDAQPLN
jgi:hypothetical protein